ncbi:hypothetical protein D3C87_1095790 [compost metagenome]
MAAVVTANTAPVVAVTNGLPTVVPPVHLYNPVGRLDEKVATKVGVVLVPSAPKPCAPLRNTRLSVASPWDDCGTSPSVVCMAAWVVSSSNVRAMGVKSVVDIDPTPVK